MITISEHSFEEKIINPMGYVLDLGCINFMFSCELKKYCDNIISLDPNLQIEKAPCDVFFEKVALIHDNKDEIDFHIYNDKHGNSILNPRNDVCSKEGMIRVKTTTLENIMKKYQIQQFELIKFDIEGAEYDILKNIDWRISKQYSIEFHDFRGMNPEEPNNEKYYEELFQNMLVYCDVIQHNKTNHPGFPSGIGENYWDSLFILKKEYWLV